MKIEEPVFSTSLSIEAKTVEEAKQIIEKQMSDPELWKNFWNDLYQMLIDNDITPKWKPENCGLPIQIKNKA